MLLKVILYRNDDTDSYVVFPRKKKEALGQLPVINRDGYVFLGWYDNPALGQGVRYNQDSIVTKKLKLYAHWSPIKKKGSKYDFNHMTSNWENDAKNQTSLEMGTSTYEEYVEDLKEHNPFRPDDEMHDELESYNEIIVNKLRDRNATLKDNFAKHKARMEMAKREFYKKHYSTLEREVEATPDPEDDRRLAEFSPKSYVVSDGITVQELEQTMNDFVLSK